MSEKRFISEEITIISFFKGADKEENWWTVRDQDSINNTFEVRNKETAKRLELQLNSLDEAKMQVIKENKKLENKIRSLKNEINNLKFYLEECREG